MAYIQNAPENADNAQYFRADESSMGYVANFTKVFAWRPEVYGAWQRLNGAIKAGMDLRRYELATVAAARRLRSSYCALAHGKVLRDNFLSAGQVRDTVIDHHAAGLDDVDVAIMDFADKVAGGASRVTQADVEALRAVGLSDQDIADVAFATAARCFFSTVLDALGAEPDAAFNSSLEPELREALTVGRPIAQA